MAPHAEDPILKESEEIKLFKKKRRPLKYKYSQIFQVIITHGLCLYGLLFKIYYMKIWTIVYTIVLILLGILGVTAGAHRLWSHRSFKATWPLKAFLVFCYTLSNNISIYHWVQLHRVHHKYVDTEADPHDITRGIFYSHMGWFMVESTPEYKQRKKQIDMSDALNDPFVRIHLRLYNYTVYIMLFLPALIPIYMWGEDPFLSFLASGAIRMVVVINCILSINSYAHVFGIRPYNKHMEPRETKLVSFFTLGEGWHNYHHTFPWDYKAAEFGDSLNLTARFLDLCEKLGLAYDLKSVSPEMIAKMIKKNGDGSYSIGTIENNLHSYQYLKI